MKNLLGIDLGSGGCKVTVIDASGKVLAQAYEEYETRYPHPGWAEQDPRDWELALGKTLTAIFQKSEFTPADIGCLAIGAATHTVVLLDPKGRILRPAILWTDRRTIGEVEWLKKNFEEMIIGETYHAPNVNWTLPYLLWVRKNEPEVWRQVDKLLMPKDYVRYRLTGKMATDFMDAHGTLLFNVPQKKWSEKICEATHLSPGLLPEVLPALHIAGEVSAEASVRWGLAKGTPVLVGTTDQACEAFGSGAIRPGSGILKLATAGNVAVVTERAHPSPPRVYAYYHLVDGQWYTLSGTSSCAVALRWLRNTFFPETGGPAYRQMDTLAEEIPPGSEGLLFHPSLQGSLGNPYLRADFLGIMSSHRRGHFVRAVLEGVAFSLYDCLRREEALGVKAEEFRLIGGGAKSPLWRKIMCDVFGREMRVPLESDASFGTALLAGVGIGLFKSLEEAVKQAVRIADTLEPDLNHHKLYRELFACYEASEAYLKEVYQRLHGLATAAFSPSTH
jgi:xylulokinase